jgi:hypothetical protein
MTNLFLMEAGSDAIAKYQVDWKLQAPYCRRRGLAGLDGLIALYKDYRALTDELYARLTVPKLAIETSAHAWATDDDRVVRTVVHPMP